MIEISRKFWMCWREDAWRVYSNDGELVLVSQSHTQAVEGWRNWVLAKGWSAVLYGPEERHGPPAVLSSVGFRREC